MEQQEQSLNKTSEAVIEKVFEKEIFWNPLISVITAFMNEAEYLAQTIESVLNQTYSNWEYILVDDGSSDGCSEIAMDYANRFPGKIFYYEHEGHRNKGVCATRNLGISKANGEYIALLDGDDLWLPAKLETQVDLALQYPNAVMLCEASHYLNKGRNPKIENIDVPVGATPETIYRPPALTTILYPLGKGDAPCVGSLFINTEFVRKIGGFVESFHGRFSFYEDQAFLFKIYYHGYVYISSSCNNIYRQRPDSSMHRLLAAGNYREGRKYFLKWLKNYLREQQRKYSTIKKAYRKAWLLVHYPKIYNYTYGLLTKLKPASG